MFGRIKISNEECVLALTEINGIAPDNWFVAKNKGKDKKVNHGFLINNTEDTIQLIPIKKENKAYIIDKENIITLSITENIKKCVLVIEDTHDHFYIYLNNGNKIKTVVRKKQFDKNRKAAYKVFRKQFRKESLLQQSIDIIFSALIVLLACSILIIELLTDIPNDTMLYKHYEAAYDLKQMVDSGYFDEYMAVTLEQYPYSDLEFEGNISTITHGRLKMSLPKDCKLNKEASLEDSTTDGFVTYTTGLGEEKALSVMIDYHSIDFSESYDEKSEKFMDAIRDVAIKEFGFSLDNHYNLTKAMWQMNEIEENINYFSRNEVALYRFLLIMKTTMSSGENNYYEINTPTYCGFVSVRNHSFDDNNFTTVNLDLYSYDNLDVAYQVTIIVKNGDINDAYKIFNSVELVTE